MPRSPASILKAARESEWGFGPISLVFRFNHPASEPFFVCWMYDLPSGKWRFDSARARNGQPLNINDVRTVLEYPDALLPEDPHGPDQLRRTVP